MTVSTRRKWLKQASALAAGIALTHTPLAALARAADDELAYLSAIDLAQKIRRKDISAVELTRHFIARIERYDGALNAVVIQDFERALDAAKHADALYAKGSVLGPLHGLPMTIKESYDIAGLPSSWGVPDAADNIARQDSVVVQKFKEAGAHFMGKTNVPFMLGDFQSYNAIHGTTNNPWDTGRTPGGSSGGSAAALAAGLTGLESGSDIGGSIRNPAHYCGVYGHKPTLSIVPMRGHQPPGVPPDAQEPDLSVVGPMARTAEDLSLSLDLLAGPDYLTAPGWRLELPAPRFSSLKGVRVALWADEAMAPVDNSVKQQVAKVGRVLEQAGAVVSDSARPAFSPAMSHETYMAILSSMIGMPGPELKYTEWMALNGRRGFLRTQWQQFFKEWDVLICPISATPAFKQDESPDLQKRTLQINGAPRPYFEQLFWPGLATVSYLPSTVFPTGLVQGLPVGLQAIGPEYGDKGTIEFTRLMAEQMGGFTPPPGYT